MPVRLCVCLRVRLLVRLSSVRDCISRYTQRHHGRHARITRSCIITSLICVAAAAAATAAVATAAFETAAVDTTPFKRRRIQKDFMPRVLGSVVVRASDL